MDDLITKLTNILNTKEGQEQLKNIQSVLAPNMNDNDINNNQVNQNNNGFDMSALTSMLGGFMGNNENNQSVEQMPISVDAISQNQVEETSQIETQEQGQNQSQNGNGFDMSALSSMLGGLMGNGDNTQQQNQSQNGNGFDMSALSSMLGGLMGNGDNTQQQNQAQNGNGFDMSALSSMLGGLMGNGDNTQQQNQAQNGNGFDMSALASMLGGANGGIGDLGGIDMNMILNLQKIFAGLNKNDKNTQLLQALKPHLSEKRCKKVDTAISFLRLFAMLPALKESGIFKGL